MRLSLIGMSGSGKSTWSSRLEMEGFRRFCCDDLIAEELSDHLLRTDGSRMDLGEWMGFPYEAGYQERESKYLAYEIQVLREILSYLWSLDRTRGEKVVIDTTGSVIYTGEDVLKDLRAQTTVVHLETPPHMRLLMLNSYIKKPRPVLWRGVFQKKSGETDASALARCYEELLLQREALYKKAA
ncbi:MAG: hypothetical protein GX422_15575, partial [Deltaproteobacteria bacterium]|nr:hypothetical protein [Deltaproteobacteria bacterium]